VDKKAKQEWLC